MLIHIGNGVAIHSDDIIAVVDLQRTVSTDTQQMICRMQSQKQVTYIGDCCNTLILCRLQRGIFPKRTQELHCFLTSIGIRTIAARVNNPLFIRNM